MKTISALFKGVCCFPLLTALAALAMPSFASADIVSNLVENWTFEGNLDAAVTTTNGGTFISDVGGATPTFTAGVFGQGIDLENDNNEFVSIGGTGSQFDFASATVSAWFSTESLSRNWQTVISNGEGDAFRLGRQFNRNNAVLGGGGGDIRLGDISSTTGFHHIVGVWENGVASRLWVDGVEVGSDDTTDPLGDDNDNDSQLLIGANPDAAGRQWDGIIDDVGIWNAALSDAEILSIYNGGAGASIASLTVSNIPEPSSLALLLFGATALAGRRRRS